MEEQEALSVGEPALLGDDVAPKADPTARPASGETDASTAAGSGDALDLEDTLHSNASKEFSFGTTNPRQLPPAPDEPPPSPVSASSPTKSEARSLKSKAEAASNSSATHGQAESVLEPEAPGRPAPLDDTEAACVSSKVSPASCKSGTNATEPTGVPSPKSDSEEAAAAADSMDLFTFGTTNPMQLPDPNLLRQTGSNSDPAPAVDVAVAPVTAAPDQMLHVTPRQMVPLPPVMETPAPPSTPPNQAVKLRSMSRQCTMSSPSPAHTTPRQEAEPAPYYVQYQPPPQAIVQYAVPVMMAPATMPMGAPEPELAHQASIEMPPADMSQMLGASSRHSLQAEHFSSAQLEDMHHRASLQSMDSMHVNHMNSERWPDRGSFSTSEFMHEFHHAKSMDSMHVNCLDLDPEKGYEEAGDDAFGPYFLPQQSPKKWTFQVVCTAARFKRFAAACLIFFLFVLMSVGIVLLIVNE